MVGYFLHIPSLNSYKTNFKLFYQMTSCLRVKKSHALKHCGLSALFVLSLQPVLRVNKWSPGVLGNCELLSVFFCFKFLFIFKTNDHFVKISEI